MCMYLVACTVYAAVTCAAAFEKTEIGKDLLIKLAQELGKINSPVALEGHTDSQLYAASVYTNWELSADRANAARRIMQSSGLRKGQVSQVRGFADQQLRVPDKPADPSNRRVSIIVQYRSAEVGNERPEKTAALGGTQRPDNKNDKAESGKPAAHDGTDKAHESKPEPAKKHES